MDHKPGKCPCWGQIVAHLAMTPDKPIMPRPEFCQDAAYVAMVLDGRMKKIEELLDRVEDLKCYL